MILSRVAALTLAVGLTLGVAAGPAVGPVRAASVQQCGTVTAYIPATLLGTGLLTVDAVPYVVAPGTSIASAVAPGADLCFGLTLDVLGLVTAAAVTPNVSTLVELCGEVSRYTAATSTTAGALDVAGRAFVIAAGTRLPSAVAPGADVCLELTLNGLGQVDGGSATLIVAVTAPPLATPMPTARPTATPPRAVATPRPGAAQPAVSPVPATGTTTSPKPAAQAPTLAPTPAAPTRSPSASTAATPTPSATAIPTAVAAPAATPAPFGTNAAPVVPASDPASTAGDSGPSRPTDIVPGPSSLARTGLTVAVNAIPLAFVGVFGLAAGWYANRRRDDEDAGESTTAGIPGTNGGAAR